MRQSAQTSYYRLQRAFNIGDFDYCQYLIETELKKGEVKPHFKEAYGIYKVRILTAQGKKSEAEQAVGSIPWVNTDFKNPYYLQKYLLIAKTLDNQTKMKEAIDHLLSINN